MICNNTRYSLLQRNCFVRVFDGVFIRYFAITCNLCPVIDSRSFRSKICLKLTEDRNLHGDRISFCFSNTIAKLFVRGTN